MARRGGRREYPRSARVGHLIQEILAETIERIDDDRLTLVSITGVDVDNELEKAVVFFDADDPEGAMLVLDELTPRLRSAVSREARIRRTPRLEFQPDSSIVLGDRVEEILSVLEIPPPDED